MREILTLRARWREVRPAKAGMFSGRQTHRGKSQSPVAWVASLEETNAMKPTDKAILGMVSKSPGRNASEPTGGLENLKPRRPSLLPAGEGSMAWRKTDCGTRSLRRGGRDSTVTRAC